MKTYTVFYRYRGSNYKYMTPYTMTVRANSIKEARLECLYSVGDVFMITKVVEVK